MMRNNMRIQILGVCGTFMAGIAVLAKQLGHTVTGFDQAFYSPMKEQLEAENITLQEGYSEDYLDPVPDLVIVGNAMKRGNPMVERILNQKIPYISGPEWLYHEVLSKQKKVLAVAGTHGKTTTSSMLAWVLECTGNKPGFLIGGIPQNFGVSARLGDGDYFVIEADEYDTAFFDKRSKFVHYHPDILIINNLEFDHADIFPDLAAIQRQFHHMIRAMPSEGCIVRPAESSSIDETLAMGCWSKARHFLSAELNHDGTEFHVNKDGKNIKAEWSILGEHNVSNALAVLTVIDEAGISLNAACAALNAFQNVKRRLEIKGTEKGITVYDDFAHHPTAIAATLGALRSHVKSGERIIAILHLASNSMRMGIYEKTLGPALKDADNVFALKPETAVFLDEKIKVLETVDDIVATVVPLLQPHDHVLIMSNGNFQHIHEKFLTALTTTVL